MDDWHAPLPASPGESKKQQEKPSENKKIIDDYSWPPEKNMDLEASSDPKNTSLPA